MRREDEIWIQKCEDTIMVDFLKITDGIRAVYKTDDFLPLHAPCFIGREKEYLVDCIDSTYVSSVGGYVDKLEKMVADYTGAKKAVVCVNGTNALYMALLLCGVEREDEVITQALSFVATCNAISYALAHPVFVDVDRDTLGLSPIAMRKWLEANAVVSNGECRNINTGRRIKACVPMHTFGHPCRIDELSELCGEYNIELVEDAAESIGSFYKGKHTGTFGKVGAISFNGNKTITTGGGGMMLFNDEKLGERAKHITTQAKIAHRWEFVHDEVGYNLRMPNINAALGCAQMEYLNEFVQNKRETAEIYKRLFSRIEGVRFVTEPENGRSNYWLQAIEFDDKGTQQAFLKFSNDRGVMTRPIWQLMNRLPMFERCECGVLENSEFFSDRIVNIPSGVRL